jgi:hypothetical protein
MARTRLARRNLPEAPKLPANTTNVQAMEYWKRFTSGEAEWAIAEACGRDLKTIEACLGYAAFMIGAPTASIERGRLMASYHNSMARLTDEIERQRLRIAELDEIVSEGPKVAAPDAVDDEEDVDDGRPAKSHEERVDLSMKSWLAVSAQRDASISVLVKLQTELRNVQAALYEMFGLKHLAKPDEDRKDEEETSNLGRFSVEELKALVGTAIDAEYDEAETDDPEAD